MTKVKQKVDFSGQTIYVGIDVHLKSWNISLYCNQQYLNSFHQPPTPQALQTYLANTYPNAVYKCAYESGFLWLLDTKNILTKRHRLHSGKCS